MSCYWIVGVILTAVIGSIWFNFGRVRFRIYGGSILVLSGLVTSIVRMVAYNIVEGLVLLGLWIAAVIITSLVIYFYERSKIRNLDNRCPYCGERLHAYCDGTNYCPRCHEYDESCDE